MSAEMPKMPEPFARISSVMGKVMLFDAPDFTMRKGDAVYTAEQMRAYTRQAMEQFERQVSEWMHVPTLKLRAGEMTAQEVRTVIGVLGAIRALIPQDPDHLAGVGNMVDGKDQSEERHG